MKYTSSIRRRFGILLIVVAFAGPTQAQLIRGYGIKVGPTFSNVRSPDLDLGGEEPISFDTKRRRGFVAFAFIEWLDAPSFSVVTEGGYAQRGYATKHDVRDGQNEPVGMVRFEDRFDYLSFAALAKLRLPGGSLTPYALGGPRLDLFLGGNPNEEGTLAAAYSATALGGTFGIGAETAELLPILAFVEIRYSFDVTNSAPDVPRDAYNNAFDLLVGVRL